MRPLACSVVADQLLRSVSGDSAVESGSSEDDNGNVVVVPRPGRKRAIQQKPLASNKYRAVVLHCQKNYAVQIEL